MKKEIKIKDKDITIYLNEDNYRKNIEANNAGLKKEKLPIVIINTFDENGEEIWNVCKHIKCPSFNFACISNVDWDKDMSIWETEKIKGSNNGADKYIKELTEKIVPKIVEEIYEVEEICEKESVKYKTNDEAIETKENNIYLVGYSKAGLFSIYSLYKTDMFRRVASISGSLWYPGFVEFVENNKMKVNPEKIYFSLGNKESKTKNELFAKVEQNTKEIETYYSKKGIQTIYEENEGNHFQDVSLRIAKAIKWILE